MKTLVCTVGGSPEPIVQAIQQHRPDHVVFVCSDDDPMTGAKGSYAAVASANPSIPGLAGLPPDSWSVVRVPADDPSAILGALESRLMDALERGVCVVDYTGGTKSMSAALFHLGVTLPGLQLSLVTGARSNLIRVESGFERARPVTSTTVHTKRLKDAVADCWRRYRYADAALLIDTAPVEWRDDPLDRSEILSRAFARWDAWSHSDAKHLLDAFGRHAGPFLHPLSKLTAQDSRESDAYRVFDLYASVARRERQHQHDAAVLRLYRVFEWVAQWTLRWDSDIDTADVPSGSQVAVLAHEGPDGKLVLACDSAWKAVATLDGPLNSVAKALGHSMQTMMSKRNSSLLAHGRAVLTADDVAAGRSALHAAIWPTFLAASKVREYQLPTQVP